jgi:hypothetical protein
MSIRSSIGNTISSIKESVSDILNRSKNNLSSKFGQSTSSATLPGNGFVGMNGDKMEELYDEIRRYIRRIEEEMDSYNFDESITEAYKGSISEPVKEFLNSAKLLLKGYVSTLNDSIKEAQGIYEAYLEAQKNISNDTMADAEELRSEANKFDL